MTKKKRFNHAPQMPVTTSTDSNHYVHVEMFPQLEVDCEVGAAYIKLMSAKVAHTVELSDDFLVDYDEFEHIVGIEILNYPN